MSRKLHLGGEVRKEGWEVLNAMPGDHVDHVCNANDLSIFEENTFDEIYASHILEHFDYRGELLNSLKEWLRVLKPGGKAYISVPDMDILCQLFLAKDHLSVDDRFEVMRIMFGGHMNEYDFHYAGLNLDILATLLNGAGYTNIVRVQNFNLFKDTSTTKFKGVPVSLNVIAEKQA